ncbi:hypothetical protein Pint_26750 [Pistacia integerrima]|uniref:Uncharacterized protein n=1 Tax=Pistacia integerrima TaxID=434235 RepID=A0ACC0YSW9_9ROSI|nr:hypothetical protein Pint_26750 [Pistacia integerrima]
MISAFAPPPHLLASVGPVVVPAASAAAVGQSWVYLPRATAPAFQVSHGCVIASTHERGAGGLAYGGRVGDLGVNMMGTPTE